MTARNAAKRKAVKEEKKRSSAEARPTPESAALVAYQVSKGDYSGGRLTLPGAVEGASVQDEPAQASEGGANVEASLEVDRVLESQLPGQDVGLLDETLELAEEKPLTTVQEDAVLEDLNVSSHLESKAEVLTETAQVIESKLTSPSLDLDIRLGSHDVAAPDPQRSELAAKAYVAREVSRWEQVRSECVYQLSVDLDVQEVSGRPPILEYHADDTEGDLLMTDHKFDLLGRNYVLRLRMTGLRPVRSSDGSTTGEPNSKRRQYRPPREYLLTSLPSVLPSSSSSRMESIQDTRTSSRQDADTLPSQVGTTDGSSLVATTSGLYASRNSSSGSSSAALGYTAGSQMQYAGYGPMVMSAQAFGTALIQAACAEAARVERERVEALALQHIQQQRAEDDKRHEAESAAWAHQAQAGLEVQQWSLLKKRKDLESVRVQEQEAARDMQKFQAEQIHNLKASSADTQTGRATTALIRRLR
ncbi:unnamed protein product [Phytophthora fragariaefolia]|uniref:Unnamed protein product n=1 Tax=Phytophthora fragariaefolia TaxID=1490495 RepID=A0A9W7CQY0_9STRA|nr:unnamed protein product [Phytophthora fragariaefolia]